MSTVPTPQTPWYCIRNAMRDSGYLSKLQDPTPAHIAEYMPRLNAVMNAMQTQGLKLWLNFDYAVTLVAGQNLYTFGPTGNVVIALKPTRVIDGYYIDSSANRRPLYPLGRTDWDTLSTTSTQGPISNYFIDKQQTTLNAYTWLTPDTIAAQGSMHLILQQQVGQVASIYDTMNFPTEWFLALEWGLADQICTGQPNAIVTRCQTNAIRFFNLLNDWDVEDASTYFTVDSRMMTQGVGRFNK